MHAQCNARVFNMKERSFQSLGIGIVLSGKTGCLTIGKEVVKRCKECGLTLTDAGAAYPYHNDPNNSHIRIAPSYVSLSDLELAMKILVLAVKIETLSK